MRDDRRVRAQAEHDAAVGDLSERHVRAGLHRRAVDAERHAQRFRARDVGRRDVVDVAHRPAQTIDALGLVHLLQRVEQIGHGGVVDHVLVDVPAGARCRGRELAVLVHDLGGPGILARRQIEERSVEHFAEAEDAELAVELIRAAALDERRGLGRRRGIRRVERQRLPEPERQRPLGRASGQEVRLAQAVDARESRRIQLVHEIREVLLALRGRGRRHGVVQRIGRLERHEPRGVAARAVGRIQARRL